MAYEDDAEMETLTSPSGGRRQPNNNNNSDHQRRGLRGLGRGGRGQRGSGGGRRGGGGNNRRGGGGNNNNRDFNEEEQRRIRKWGPRGVMRRIRGKGIPGQEGEKPEGESLLTENDGDGGFYDNDPYGDMDYDEEESRPITDMGDDDEEDFLDPGGYIDYSQDSQEYDEDEEVCGDDDDDGGDYESGSEEEEDGDEDEDGYEKTGSSEDGEWGRYDDEYENKPTGNSTYRDGGGSYHDGDGGYKDGGGSYRDGEGYDDRGGYSDRRDYGRQNRNGPRNVVLRQLNKIRRPGRRSRGRGRNSSSNLDHTNLRGSGSSDPYFNSNTNVRGRIEGFGSKPDVEQQRNLREMLKNFRDRRIAARNGEGGMKKMSMSGEPSPKKNWIERIDSAIDAMADAALQHPGFDGYMTSSARTVTVQKKAAAGSAGPKDLNKQSYLRTQFGDDNAYIIYLEGEKVATELEVLSYKNRIKELEAEIRKLKGIEDGHDSDSSDDDSSAASGAGETDEKESEIEWQTGVPEEGVLIDIEGTTTAPNNNEQSTEAGTTTAPSSNEQSTPVTPTADLLQIPPKGSPLFGTNLTPSPTKPAEQEQEKAPETGQTEGVLVELSVRDEAKDIVDSILADLLTEKKVTSLISDEEDDSLLTMKVEPSADQTKDTSAEVPTTDGTTVLEDTNSAPPDLLPEPPADAPPPPPTDDPEPPADAPPLPPTDDPEPPADAPPLPPTDAPPEPPADVPPEPPTDVPQDEATTTGETKDADASEDQQTSTEPSESTPNTEQTTTAEVKSEE